jgi:hypothetical protein
MGLFKCKRPGYPCFKPHATFHEIRIRLRSINFAYKSPTCSLRLSKRRITFRETTDGNVQIQRILSACSSSAESETENPSVVDEGDLFAVSLLAMPVHIIGQVEFTMHMDGFDSLATHLSNNARNKGQEHTLRAFWPLVRDEMIAFGYELSKYCGEVKSMVYPLSHACPIGRAYDAFEERQNYDNLLCRAWTRRQHNKCFSSNIVSTRQLNQE